MNRNNADDTWRNLLAQSAPTFSAVAGYDFAHSRKPGATGGGLGQVLVTITGNFLGARQSASGHLSPGLD